MTTLVGVKIALVSIMVLKYFFIKLYITLRFSTLLSLFLISLGLNTLGSNQNSSSNQDLHGLKLKKQFYNCLLKSRFILGISSLTSNSSRHINTRMLCQRWCFWTNIRNYLATTILRKTFTLSCKTSEAIIILKCICGHFTKRRRVGHTSKTSVMGEHPWPMCNQAIHRYAWR